MLRVGLITECLLGGPALEGGKRQLAEHALMLFRLYVERRMWSSAREIEKTTFHIAGQLEAPEYEEEQEQFSDTTYLTDQMSAIAVLARLKPLEALGACLLCCEWECVVAWFLFCLFVKEENVFFFLSLSFSTFLDIYYISISPL